MVSFVDLGTCIISVCRCKLIVVFGTIIECLLYSKHCIVFYWPQSHLILMSPQEIGISPFYRCGISQVKREEKGWEDRESSLREGPALRKFTKFGGL